VDVLNKSIKDNFLMKIIVNILIVTFTLCFVSRFRTKDWILRGHFSSGLMPHVLGASRPTLVLLSNPYRSLVFLQGHHFLHGTCSERKAFLLSILAPSIQREFNISFNLDVGECIAKVKGKEFYYAWRVGRRRVPLNV